MATRLRRASLTPEQVLSTVLSLPGRPASFGTSNQTVQLPGPPTVDIVRAVGATNSSQVTPILDHLVSRGSLELRVVGSFRCYCRPGVAA